MDRDTRRGGAAVGRLQALPVLEATAVLTMRLWCSGPQHQAEVWSQFAQTFGGQDGAARLKSFERLMSRITSGARRPIMRHDLRCLCVGADEAVFANLIAAAADEEAHDAMLFAALLVRHEDAGHIAAQARVVGQSLRAICAQACDAATADAGMGAGMAPGTTPDAAPSTTPDSRASGGTHHRFTHHHSQTRH